MIFAAPILVALALAGRAQAHAKLVSSYPADKATVTKPGKIVLAFNEKLIASFSGADLVITKMPGMAMTGPTKMKDFTTAISADGKNLTLRMKHALVAGTYQLHWHAVGDDTHHTEGTYSFTVK